MKFYQGTNPGKVWDASVGKITIIFVDGIFETNDTKLIALLGRAGYEAGVEVIADTVEIPVEVKPVDVLPTVEKPAKVEELIDFEELGNQEEAKRTKKALDSKAAKPKMVRQKR